MMIFYRQRSSGKWRHNVTNWRHNVSDVQSDWREPKSRDIAWLNVIILEVNFDVWRSSGDEASGQS